MIRRVSIPNYTRVLQAFGRIFSRKQAEKKVLLIYGNILCDVQTYCVPQTEQKVGSLLLSGDCTSPPHALG